MTAITITVNVSDEIAHELETIPNLDQFASEALTEKINKASTKKMHTRPIGDNSEMIFDAEYPPTKEDEILAEAAMGAIDKGHYLTLDQWRAERLAKRSIEASPRSTNASSERLA
jgi:hypothetical protein